MATSSGAVQFDLKANTKPFLQEAESAASQVKSMFSGLKSVLGKTFTVGALLDFGKRCTEAASELIELQNVVEQVFPTMSDRVDEWSQNLIQSFGLSEAKAKHYAGTMASMARSMGFTEEQAYKMSTTLAELSGDIASFYDMSSDEAYDKLTSIFTGVTQPLRSLGINMTEATLNAYALAHGFERTYQEMDEAERTLLRYQFVLDRTQFAQGDAARTSNSWANQLRQLQMNFESLQATLGEQFVNALLPALQTINSIVIALDNLAQRIDIVGMALNGLAGMLPGLNRAALANGLVNRTSGLNKVLSKTNKISAAAAESTAGLASAQTGAAGSAGSQGRATEKLNRILAGFDRINKLASAHSSGGGGAGGGGGGSYGGIGSDLLDELLGTEGAKISGWNKYDLKHANRAGSADSFMFKYAKRYGTTTIASDLKDIWSNKDSDIFSKLQKSAQAIGKMLQERIKGGGVQRQLNRAGGSTLGRGIAGNVLGKSIGVDIDGLGGLAEAWNSITDKTAKLTATTAGNDKVDTLKKSYDGIKTKTVTLGATDNATAKVSAASKAIDAMKGKTVTLDASDKATSKVNALAGKVSGMKSKTITIDATDKASAKINAVNGKKLNDHWADLTVRKNDVNAQLDRANRTALKDHWADLWFTPRFTKSEIKLSGSGSFARLSFLAQGGYIDRNTPRLAVIGDNTREGEIVSPESKFQSMLDKAAGQNNDAETVRMLGLILQAVQGIDSNVYIDSKDVTRAVVSNINRQVQSTGRSPLIV